MEIMSLKNFYGHKGKESDITLYREYLRSIDSQLEEAIREATILLGKEDEAVVEMTNQRSFVRTMSLIIDSSTKEVMNNSVAKLNEEELKNIINEAIERLDEEKEALLREMNDMEEQKRQVQQEYGLMMEQKGYKASYFEADDTNEFFTEKLNTEDYIIKLIKSNMGEAELKSKVFGLLYSIDSVNDKLAEMIISLRKIARVSDENTLKKAIKVSLNPDRIGKIIGYEDEEECERIFDTIQTEAKIQSNFFKGLPKSLQKEIQSNGMTSSVAFKRLKSIYEGYLKTGTINAPQSKDIMQLVENIKKQKEQIGTIEFKINMAKETFVSRDKMEELIKSMINALELDDGWSISKVASSVNKERKEAKELREKMEQLASKINNLKDTYGTLVTLLEGDIYGEDMDIVNARKVLEIETAKDSMYQEWKSMYDIESKKLRQFKIIEAAIEELNEIKEKIEEIDRDKNIFKNFLGANRALRTEKIDQYNKAVQKYYVTLNEEGLLFVTANKPSETGIAKKALNFEDLFQGEERLSYVFSEEEYEELFAREDINSRLSLKSFNESLEWISKLETKLFKAHKREDGIYDFDISKEEMANLISMQESFLAFVAEAIDVRNQVLGAASEKAPNYYSEDFLNFVTYNLVMSTSYISRSNLEQRRDDLVNMIEAATCELNELRENNLPQEAGVANEPFDMLNGFEDTTIPSDIVKKTVRL